jgi:hypothetical protein
LDGLSKLIEALDPWLSQVVMVGGWAHRLLRYHPLAQPVPHEPLLTNDADVAVPAALEVREQVLRDRLMAADFKERFMGDDQPPATHYELGEQGAAFYAEFLTPLIGSEYDRKGKRKTTAKVGGITSQNLRYVELLLDSPWRVELSQGNGFPFETAKRVQIAHPTRFMAQKLLIHEKRDRHSRAKDILYLHDTIELLGGSLEALTAEWERLREAHSPGAIRTVQGAADTLFSNITDDIRGAVQAAAGRALTPHAVQELVRAGLKIVFPAESVHARR